MIRNLKKPNSGLVCPHPVPALPGALSRKQIVLPAVHGADDDGPPERMGARPRRLAAPSPAPVPLTGRLRRTSARPGRTGASPSTAGPAVLAPAAPSDAAPGQAHCRLPPSA